MKKFIPLFILISSISLAKSKHWVTFGNEKINLKVIESGFISENCQKCKAKSFINKIAKVSLDQIKLKNPYSVACKNLGGKVRLGKLSSGNAQSFCFAKDNSMVSTNILSFEIKKNL